MKTRKTTAARKLRRYTSTRWKNIYEYFKKYLKKKDDKSLHHARVEIKKITALFHLLDYCEKTFSSEKELVLINKIFKLSGKLRDYSNTQKFCKQFKIKKSTLKANGDKQSHIQQKLKHRLKKYNPCLNKLEMNAANFIKDVTIQNIRSYIYHTEKSISADSVANIKADKLHEIRKQIKDLLYVAAYYDHNIISKAKLKLFDQLQDTIGNLHDIDKFCKKLKDPEERKQKGFKNAKKERQKLLTESKILLSACTGRKFILK